MSDVKIERPTRVSRAWGKEWTVSRTGAHAGKILFRKKGTKGGYQWHVKEESHYLVSGRLRLRVGHRDGSESFHEVETGYGWTVPPLTPHQEEALEDSIVFEVSDPTVEDRYSLEPDPGGLPSGSRESLARLAGELSQRYAQRADYYQQVRVQILADKQRSW